MKLLHQFSIFEETDGRIRVVVTSSSGALREGQLVDWQATNVYDLPPTEKLGLKIALSDETLGRIPKTLWDKFAKVKP